MCKRTGDDAGMTRLFAEWVAEWRRCEAENDCDSPRCDELAREILSITAVGVEGLAIKAFISVHANNGGGYADWVIPSIPAGTGLLEDEAEAALLADARRFLPCKIGRAA